MVVTGTCKYIDPSIVRPDPKHSHAEHHAGAAVAQPVPKATVPAVCDRLSGEFTYHMAFQIQHVPQPRDVFTFDVSPVKRVEASRTPKARLTPRSSRDSAVDDPQRAPIVVVNKAEPRVKPVRAVRELEYAAEMPAAKRRKDDPFAFDSD